MRLSEFENWKWNAAKGAAEPKAPKNLGLVMMHLEKYASQAIETYRQTGNFLYRGTRGSNQGPEQDILLVNPLKNRKPIASPMAAQNLVDDKLRAARFHALRSNSLFCTGRRAEASHYGKEYIVFPLNGFKFTWSKRIDDFTLFFNLVRPRLEDSDLEEFLYKFGSMPYQQFIDEYGFKRDDFPGAISSHHEVYICGKSVLIADKFESDVRDILGMQESEYQKFVKDLSLDSFPARMEWP